jgi:hypothetical protein
LAIVSALRLAAQPATRLVAARAPAATKARVMKSRRVGSGIRQAVRSTLSSIVPPDAATWVVVDKDQDRNPCDPSVAFAPARPYRR